jgi:hypothetical protein
MDKLKENTKNNHSKISSEKLKKVIKNTKIQIKRSNTFYNFFEKKFSGVGELSRRGNYAEI